MRGKQHSTGTAQETSTATRKEPQDMSLETVFSHVYNASKWAKSGRSFEENGRGSGGGSSIRAAAGASRILYYVTIAFNISSIIDAPCGAMEWQMPLLQQLDLNADSLTTYLGLDVVPSVIEANAQRLANIRFNRVHVAFKQADLTLSPMPAGYELIFSRDALQHNTLDDVWTILANFATSEAELLLLGSYPRPGGIWKRKRAKKNQNVPRNELLEGGGFAIDLAEPPFSLAPTKVFEEVFEGKALYLYERLQLLSALSQRSSLPKSASSYLRQHRRAHRALQRSVAVSASRTGVRRD